MERDFFLPDCTVRVVSGPYRGAVGRYLGPRVGGDEAFVVTQPGQGDVRKGETLLTLENRNLARELEELEGIGKLTAQKLFKFFGTVKKMKDASDEDLQKDLLSIKKN